MQRRRRSSASAEANRLYAWEDRVVAPRDRSRVPFARLQSLPQEVFEAADVDSAGPFTTFRRITLPMLMPAIVFAAIFRGVDAFRGVLLISGGDGDPREGFEDVPARHAVLVSRDLQVTLADLQP